MGARGAARGLTSPTQPREGRGYAAVVVSSTFEEPVQPVGVSSMVQGAPVPV